AAGAAGDDGPYGVPDQGGELPGEGDGEVLERPGGGRGDPAGAGGRVERRRPGGGAHAGPCRLPPPPQPPPLSREEGDAKARNRQKNEAALALVAARAMQSIRGLSARARFPVAGAISPGRVPPAAARRAAFLYNGRSYPSPPAGVEGRAV